ncbi:IS630 family transposase [Streptomyces sp. MZ04]|uniref:IS630 family transposase n=1 Tax=Streptomyces sp. MZ04 TaxID=2559236 RepID=UPI001FD81032|nr:IS630 family transposase [Streptomyces sp. MZ04]
MPGHRAGHRLVAPRSGRHQRGVSRWDALSRRRRPERHPARTAGTGTEYGRRPVHPGAHARQVAQRLRVSRKSAYAWHARWRAGGRTALRSRGPSGRPSRMRPAWRTWLARELTRGPAAHGWTEDHRRTLARVATVIARRFHVRFSPAQIWRILRQMGFTAQVPVHRAAERDPHATARWYQQTWPQVQQIVRDRDAWLCFADEAGQTLRPPKARTWSRRGHPPVIQTRVKGSGRISLAALVGRKPGHSTRFIFRILAHHGRKGEKTGFREVDFARLLDAAHQQLGGDIVLLWDNYTHHVDAAMREFITARAWLTVFRFPASTPELNPVEGVWAHCKRSLANLAPCTTDELASLARTRLKRMQYRPSLLDGFIAETGLPLPAP